MKNVIFFSLIFMGMLNSCNKAEDDQLFFVDQEKNTKIFLEAVEILPQGRIKLSEGNYARIFNLNIYNQDYHPRISYSLNGEEFTDDGKFNDLVAGDGVYTSVEKRSVDLEKPQFKQLSFVSEQFIFTKYEEKGSVTVGCKVRHIRQGSSLFGVSCENWFGCFEFYDCEIEIEIEW